MRVSLIVSDLRIAGEVTRAWAERNFRVAPMPWPYGRLSRRRERNMMIRQSCPAADNARPNRSRHPVVAVLLAIILFASGCSGIEQWWHNGFKVGPNYTPPPAPVAAAWVESADRHLVSSPALDCGWWTVFGDPTLDNLVDSAYRENLNLKIAGTRILESARSGISPPAICSRNRKVR